MPLVLSGEKTTTWRLFDEKNLSAGDELQLVATDSGKVFANAVVSSVREKKFCELDKRGHETFSSDGQLYETYSAYYARPVEPETRVKIVEFKLVN